jgi:hypothetical protein
MANLPEFMNLRRKALKLTVGKLAVQLNLNPATVHKYLSGVRPLPETRVALFRDTLCPSEELKDEFNSLYEKFQVGRTRSPLELAIDSPEATLRMATLNFWPFAGEKLSSEEDPDNEFNEEVSSKAFMEKFVEKCLSLAVVHLETVDVGRRLPKGQIPFDMNQRIDAVERRKVDFIFNLMSLQRLKRLTFIPVPIRIAVNALVFQTPSADGQEQDFARLSAAKRLLVYGEQPASEPFLVITIANEIGHVFMEQAHGLKEIGKTFRADELHTHCLDPQPTLDAAFLEETMRTRSKHAPVMLVADEHTILSVLGLLKNEAALVLPPNSDQAVIHSVERRIPPAFYFGIGMRRTITFSRPSPLAYPLNPRASRSGIGISTISSSDLFGNALQRPAFIRAAFYALPNAWATRRRKGQTLRSGAEGSRPSPNRMPVPSPEERSL